MEGFAFETMRVQRALILSFSRRQSLRALWKRAIWTPFRPSVLSLCALQPLFINRFSKFFFVGFLLGLVVPLFLGKLGLYSQRILSSLLSRKHERICLKNKVKRRFFMTPLISLPLFLTQKYRAEYLSWNRPYLRCSVICKSSFWPLRR
jgi:hypothetical protein